MVPIKAGSTLNELLGGIAAAGSHAIAILTEWRQCHELDCERIYRSMAKPAFIFDSGNIVLHQVLADDVWLRSIPPSAAPCLKVFLNPFQEGCAWSIFRKIGFVLLIP